MINITFYLEDIPYHLGKAWAKCGDIPYDLGNALENSFVDYHGKIIQTFDTLPSDGKILEIALRIAAVAAAPILYPLLGLGYLANHVLHGKPISFNPCKKVVSFIAQSIPISKGQRISNQIAELKKAGLPDWQQQSMTLIRKSREDYAPHELNRLRDRKVLTNDIRDRLDLAINKVDSHISYAKRNQVMALMGQALEVKSLHGDTHDVFIHAQGSNWMGLNFLVKELHKSFNPQTPVSDFKFLRSPCKLAERGTASAMWKTFRDTLFGEEEITNVQEYINSKWYVSDNDGETREHLLSVDGYFFNPQRYESSLFFLMNDSNILGKESTIKYFYKQIIKHYRPNMSDSTVGKLANKVFNATQTNGSLCGNLFAICVPKSISKDVQYRAHPFGVKCTCHSEEKSPAILAKLQKNILEKNAECTGLTTPSIPQFRIYTPMLKPGATPIYLLTPLKKSTQRAMKSVIKSVVSEIRNHS